MNHLSHHSPRELSGGSILSTSLLSLGWKPGTYVWGIRQYPRTMVIVRAIGFLLRMVNSYVYVVIPCIIPPTGNDSVMIQPVTTCHKSLVTLHVGSRKIHQSRRAIIYLSRYCLYYKQKQTDKTMFSLSDSSGSYILRHAL